VEEDVVEHWSIWLRIGWDLVGMLPYMFYLGYSSRVDAYTLLLCFLLSLYLYTIFTRL
jgi:hypothetical protein